MFWFCMCSFVLFFFNDTATTEIYTLSLHDALPILVQLRPVDEDRAATLVEHDAVQAIEKVGLVLDDGRSEEHTSELQSLTNLVCRLLLEKKKKKKLNPNTQVEHKLNHQFNVQSKAV